MDTIIKGNKIKFSGFLSISEEQVFQVVNVKPSKNDDSVVLELVEVEK